MKFGIGVILYNPDEFVLDRLIEYSSITETIYIYDNTEGKNIFSEKISQLFSNYFSFNKNLGMSEALNKIFESSIEDNLDYVLTMDQDSDFSKESINNMLTFIKANSNDSVSIYCPNYRKIYLGSDGSDHFGKYAIPLTENKSVNFSMTSGSFCKIDEIKTVLPLKDLFIGYVDNDLCFEMLSNNKQILMVGNIGFSQRVGSPVKATLLNKFFRVVHQNELRYYYMTRNNFELQKKYKDSPKIRKQLVKNLIRIYINILIGERNKIKKIKASHEGYVDYKNGELGKKK
ncbi:glycosyltransferase [Vagococcus fluvialis]|uniref:glycosyltransferase n=1 Tax=Vagococcus fluvialis TaxID=2738 RepID=UPI001A8E1653|nr:glycosyltransferase [Vagococcus fluvialis]